MEYGLTGSTNLIYAGNDANVSVYAREEVVEDLCPMSVMLPFDRTIHSTQQYKYRHRGGIFRL